MQAGTPPPQDRRHGASAVPKFLDAYLSEEQMKGLHQAENFGWHLAFIRRPLFQDPVTVLQSSDHPDHYALLQEDGRLDLSPVLTMRA